ncbi:MAG: hypothetical protein HKM95_06345, partial [Inquilinus sp.]|nr:hypothetical protein [Inquilinus sp.]
DVLLTVVTVQSGLRGGLSAAGWATAGAVAGGAAMYRWGASDPAGVEAALLGLPAIGPEMVADVLRAMKADWGMALVRGAFTGTPYKIYAAMAPRLDIELVPFLVMSVPARLARFAGLVAITAGLSRIVSLRLGQRQQLGVLALAWIAFYGFYWTINSG